MTDASEPRSGAEPELLELLAPILELAASEQEAALAEVCRAHPERAAALCRRHAILHKFGLTAEDGLGAGPVPNEPRERFGPYRILRRLGRGGMGVVLLAEDPQLGREVALKLIRPELLASERARERFRREVGVAARLDHPGICTVYGTGEIDGQPYLALQHLRGETLEALLRTARAAGRTAWSGGSSTSGAIGTSAGRLRPAALRPALELVEQLARAVHCAHEAGLVHRDLKPGNVMVTPEGRPVLMDFGLARAADSAEQGMTGSGELVGTPIYMAPEQVAPRGRAIDRRTDVHALGVILYECLTLRPPHAGADREELYHRILTEAPIELRRLQPLASRDLATVVHHALAKEPARRYPTALAFAEDLRRVLAGEPTVARPPGPLRRAWVAALRHRTAAAVGTALAVGLVASLVFLGLLLSAQRRLDALLLVARAKDVQPEDPQVAFIAMREALEIAEEPDVVAALHGVLPDLASWSLERQTDARMESLVCSPARRFVVVNSPGGVASLHREDGKFLAQLGVDSDGAWRGVALTPQRPAVAFAPDEQAMWASCANLGLRRFQLGGGGPRMLGVPPACGKAPGATSMAWSPDGLRLLLTRWNSKTGRCWASLHAADTAEELVGDLPMPPESWGCAFRADGTLVLPGGLWSPDGRTLLHALEPAASAGARFVLVAGDRIAVVSTAGVRLFSGAGAPVGTWEREDQRGFEELTHAEWSPSGDALVASFRDGQVWILDASARILQSWNVGSTCHARFMLDGERVLTGDTKGRVIIWTRAARPQARLLGHRDNAHAVPVSGGDVLVVSWDGRAQLWHPDRTLPGLPLQSGVPRGRTLMVDGLLVVTDAEGRVRSLTPDGSVRASTSVRRGEVFVSPHRDRRTVWLAEERGSVLWHWDPSTGARQGPFALDYGARNPPVSIAHLADDRLLLANTYETWPWLAAPERNAVSEVETFKASYVAAADGGRVVIAVGTDEPGARAPADVKLLALKSDGESVLWSRTDPAGSGKARGSALALSADGRRALVGFANGAVSLWDVEAKSRIAWWRDHTDVVNGVAITPDGRHVASCTRQGHLVVRRLGAESPELTWRSQEERFRTLAFVDDHTLVSTGIDLERVRWWWWEPSRLREVLARVSLPALDAEQRLDLARLLRR